jgi:hypothetical protein
VCADARVGVARDAILAESIKKRQRRDDARAASTTRSLSDARVPYRSVAGKEKNANNLSLRSRIF